MINQVIGFIEIQRIMSLLDGTELVTAMEIRAVFLSVTEAR